MTETTTNPVIPGFNADHTRAVLAQLLSHPEQHSQDIWFSQNCETKGCVAGWSAVLAGRTMIRPEPGQNIVNSVSIKPEELPVFQLMNPYLTAESFHDHWTPTPEFLLEKADHNAAMQEYHRVEGQREEILRANPYAPDEELPEYPSVPEYPWPSRSNYANSPMLAVTVAEAARVDMGISPRLATWLFEGNRTIGQITAVLGIMIHTEGNEESAFEWINRYRGYRELDSYVAAVRSSLRATEISLHHLRERFNSLNTKLSGM